MQLSQIMVANKHLMAGISALVLLLVLCACGGGSSSAGSTGGGGGGGGGSKQISISLIEPTTMMAGIPTPMMRIHGQNFLIGTQVFMDGVPADIVLFDSTSLLEAGFATFLPAGVHQITVSATTTSNALPFTIYPPQQGPLVMQTPAGFYSGVMNANAITTADVNNDGRSDVILAGMGEQNQFTVLYGQADGTLSTPQFVPVNPAVSTLINTVISGDVDGDGNQDVVAVGIRVSGAMVNVLLGDGQGNFQPVASPQSFPADFAGPGFLVDMDGDGKPDLVLEYQTPLITAEQDIVWLKNTGGGNFGPPTTVASNTANVGFVISDFDDDGKPDIVYSAAGPPQSLRYLKNLGNGQFSDRPIAGLNGTFGSPTAIDFNLDGIPDLVVQGNGFFYSFAGNGDGSFTQVGIGSMPGQVGYTNLPLFVGDFDHDGFPDLAGGSIGNEPASMMYLFGDGHGNFTPQMVVGPYGFYSAVGDFNGDGLPDVVAADTDFVSVSLGRKDRNFPSAQSLSPNMLGVVSTGDVLGNGFKDVFVSGDSISIQGNMFQNVGGNSFQMASSIDPTAFAIVDLTGRGKADLLGNSFAGLVVWPNNGSLDFSGSSPITVPLPVDPVPLQIADVDGDGHPDIVAGGAIWYGNGAYTFVPVATPVTWPYLVGDFNGDGKLDFLTGVSAYLNTGTHSFRTVQSSGLNLFGSPTATVGDFNGDGKDDVALASPGGQVINIYYSNGDGTFYRGANVSCGQGPVYMGTGNFGGTGRVDIVVALQSSYQGCILFNQGNGQFTRSFFASGALSVGMVTGDLNGDHKPDLVISNFPFSFFPPNVTVVLHK